MTQERNAISERGGHVPLKTHEKYQCGYLALLGCEECSWCPLTADSDCIITCLPLPHQGAVIRSKAPYGIRKNIEILEIGFQIVFGAIWNIGI
jgi:hypothetical protein